MMIFVKICCLVLILKFGYSIEDEIFRQKTRAQSYLTAEKHVRRVKRDNTGYFEERTPSNFERECIEESCSPEEIKETAYADIFKNKVVEDFAQIERIVENDRQMILEKTTDIAFENQSDTDLYKSAKQLKSKAIF